jgi:hypothetical protein
MLAPAKNPAGLEDLKRKLFQFGVIAALVIVAVLLLVFVSLTWPACLLFAVACAAWLIARAYARRRDSRAARAAAKVAFPYACGFAVLTLLQLAYNLGRSDAGAVSRTEVWLLEHSGWVDILEKLSWWQYVSILVVLAAAGALVPRLGLLRNFVRAADIAGTVSTALTAVTAFTFVTAAIGGSDLRQAEVTFRARLADKVMATQKVMADTMARRAEARALERIPPASVKALAAVAERMHESRASRSAVDILLDRALGEQVRPEEKPPEPAAPAKAGGTKVRGDELVRELAGEDAKAAEAGGANKASRDAVAAALDRLADNASDAARERVRDILEHALGDGIGPILTAAIVLGDGFTAEYLADAREKLMAKASEFCDGIVGRIAHLGQPDAAASAIRSRVRSAAVDEAVRMEDGRPGNAEFERLSGGVLAAVEPGPGGRTGHLTSVIDIATELTPGARRVDWALMLPPAEVPGGPRVPASAPFERPGRGPVSPLLKAAAAAEVDAQLERAIAGVPAFRETETTMAAAMKERAEALRQENDKLKEAAHEQVEVEPHGAP